MKKRVLSLALCLVLVVGLFSGLTVNASAGRLDDLKKEIAEKLIKEKIEKIKEELEIPDLDTEAIISSFTTAATEGDFGVNNCLHWEVSTGVLSGKTLTISGTGAMPDFDFPNGNLAPWWNYEALGMLTSFGNFKLEGELKKVVIKDGVTNVSDYALFFLPAATQVTLPDSVTSIGRYGIAMCSKLTGLSIPKGVTGIGDFGLAGNGLTAVTLPDGLQSLGRGAFDSCASLTNTTLPAAITAVPGKCFADCTKLLNVKYAGTVTTAPTETTPGVRTFTCSGCGQTRTEAIPATGAHDYRFTKTVDPTCTDGGYDLYTCSGCGATEKRNLTDAAGHKWDGGTVTTAPTETTPGVRTFTCTVCGQTRTEAIPATGASTCTGGPSCPSYGLHDVAGPGYWAHEGIDYCVRNRLMSGVGAGTFSPDTACTRAQIVKILYNRSGNQTDYSYYYLPFTDVAPGAWYYNAVAWAYYNDVTSGTSATMFTPNAAITRQQLVTFLYRYTVKYAPEFTGNAAPISAFPDVGSVANWAYAAMSWAVGNGLIQGNAHDNGLDYLDPNGSATRAQTATIIMRYCQLIGA